jgi:tetratricopeptide (TPR) repeat protein
VKTDFALMRAHCADHGGEVLNSMGDGLLMCFPSAVQAVTCALQIQSEFGKRRATLPPEQALEHRMGVHIGDVIRQDDGGVAGDGVNIAARLEGKAPVGGVCISQMVYDTVQGKVPMQAVFIGPEMFKNITNPIPIWHIAPEGQAAPASRPQAKTTKQASRRMLPVWVAAAALVLAAGGFWWWTQRGRGPTAGTTKVAEPPKSETQKLIEQARTLFTESSVTTTKLDAAVAVAEQALKLEPTNPDALAIASQLDSHMLLLARTPERLERARARAEQAIHLAPQAQEPRIAHAWFLVIGLGPPQSYRAETDLLALRRELPNDWRVCWLFAILRLMQGRTEDTVEILEDGAKRASVWSSVAWTQRAVFLTFLGRYSEVEQSIDLALAQEAPANNAYALKTNMELSWRGNLDGALAIANKMAVDDQNTEIGVATFERVYRWRREPANALKFLSQDAREWIGWDVSGPKAALKGEAYKALGDFESARAEWQLAVKQIDERLAATPNDRVLLEWKAYLLAELGQRDQAQMLWKRALGLARPKSKGDMYDFEKIQMFYSDEEIMAELERRAERAPAPPAGIRLAIPNPKYTFISAADLRLNPAWDKVRELPRFKALQAKLDKDPRFSPTATAE